MAQFRGGPTPEDEKQFGRQTPNGDIVWQTEKVAEKLGWTTPAGRLRDQAKFDQELRQLGLALHEGNILRWFTRLRYTAVTEPVEITDVEAAPVVEPIPVTAPEDALADLGLAEPEPAPATAQVPSAPTPFDAIIGGAAAPLLVAEGPVEVGTAIDVSGSAEEGDPTHLIVNDDGLLIGTATASSAPEAQTVPEWAQTPAATTSTTPSAVPF